MDSRRSPTRHRPTGASTIGVVSARSATDWLRLLTSATLKRAEKSPLTKIGTASKIEITFDRSLPWEVDGGDRDRTNKFEIECVPAAVRICQPHLSTGELADAAQEGGQ